MRARSYERELEPSARREHEAPSSRNHPFPQDFEGSPSHGRFNGRGQGAER